jgi:ferrochelatase
LVAISYDAVLLVSFGGPEGPRDVIPFLENVVRGKNVPRERLLAVAEHYQHFGGVSPLNGQNRALSAALAAALDARGPALAVYWGNRNWRPMLADALERMTRDGVRRALAFVTSAYSSYSSCRQYLEDIERARASAGPSAPQVDKLRAFYNHPGFIAPTAARVREAFDKIPAERRAAAQLVFTAHSIPQAMADACDYAAQLAETSRLVAESLGLADYRLAYQSRSGPPQQPWLGPDICDLLRELSAGETSRDVVVAPIGFLSDHIEILWDLDTEARGVAESGGLNMIRAATVGSHPDFVHMIRELILERVAGAPRQAMGRFGPAVDECPADCCRFTAAAPGRPR